MDELLFFVYWFKHCRASRRWHSIVTIEDVNFVKWRLGVKTEFCPLVPGFCPGLSGILSCCDRFVSWFALNMEGRTLRTGVLCSSIQSVKSDADSAVVSALVQDVLVQITCLAREPDVKQDTFRQKRFQFNLFPFRDRSELKTGKWMRRILLRDHLKADQAGRIKKGEQVRDLFPDRNWGWLQASPRTLPLLSGECSRLWCNHQLDGIRNCFVAPHHDHCGSSGT